ncbi:MAG: TlpA family protein disulfide reductase [Aridibacter famidurans]|nr:TlpA family protein disulfide reductase [Aridibacter famidurans]
MALSILVSYGFSQERDHEYADIELKDIEYKNWTYPNGDGEGKTELRDYLKGKKLVMVFYFAPWCHSSKYQSPITQELYEKYKDAGFGVIGVSMYDTEEALTRELERRKFTFPVVVESTQLSARKTSQHFKYRWSTGDYRKWGTPWNIFLTPSELKTKGDVLTEKAWVVNGEIRKEQAEEFIRDRLGLG